MSQATISPRQVNFVRDLVTERKQAAGVTDIDAFIAVVTGQRLTKKGASTLIDSLLKLPKDAEPTTSTADHVETPTHRANGYAAKCAKCGVKVPAREGALTKEGGRWITRHLDGQCPQSLQDQLNELLEGQDDGFFAVPYIGTDAHTDLTFFGIRTRNNDKADRYVVHTIGGHADTEDVTIEWTERALASLATLDRRHASEAYGRMMGYCGACGRHLTNESSRALGLGPDCAAR